MATLNQMIVTERTLTLVNGKVYKLKRPTLEIRFKYMEYMDRVKAFAEIDVTDPDVDIEQLQTLTRDMLDTLVDLIETWVKQADPAITREQIIADLTDIDSQNLQVLIQDFEAEIEAACPPVLNRAQRRARVKPIGEKSTAG